MSFLSEAIDERDFSTPSTSSFSPQISAIESIRNACFEATDPKQIIDYLAKNKGKNNLNLLEAFVVFLNRDDGVPYLSRLLLILPLKEILRYQRFVGREITGVFYQGKMDHVLFLLNSGLPIYYFEPDGEQTIFDAACAGDQAIVVVEMINRKVEYNKTNKYGMRPIHQCIACDSIKCFKILLGETEPSKRMFEMAVDNMSSKVMAFIFSKGVYDFVFFDRQSKRRPTDMIKLAKEVDLILGSNSFTDQYKAYENQQVLESFQELLI